MIDESYYRKTDEIISRYVRDARSLIPIMQDIQAEYRYLPKELFKLIGVMVRQRFLKEQILMTLFILIYMTRQGLIQFKWMGAQPRIAMLQPLPQSVLIIIRMLRV